MNHACARYTTMAAIASSGMMHKQLIMVIGQYLPTASQEFKDFKRILPLNRRDMVDNSASAEDLLEVWERKGGFKVGEYIELIRVLQQVGLEELLETVKKRADDIHKQLEIESRAAPDPVEHAPDPPENNESPPDYYS